MVLVKSKLEKKRVKKTSRMETPFYLRGTGLNVIDISDIEIFKKNNPDLSHFFDKYRIELRLLDISEFESLVFWIVSQQISGRVANILIDRLRERFPDFSPEIILDTDESVFREIGLSGQKIKYVKNVAKYFVEHKNSDFSKLSDEEVIKELTSIKGVGEWTVQMHMIFSEGRKNVLAIKDLGVRKGLQVIYGLDHIPTEKEAKKLCVSWPPRATVGTLLCWAVIGEG